MVNRDRRIQRRPRVAAQAFRNLPVMARAAGQLYKAGSRALQPREKPRKKSKGKGKSAVGALPRDRIGRNNGLIVSNQKVPRPKKGSVQYRKSNFGIVESLNKVWIGGSSIGQQSTHMRTIAHAILAHYLPKIGDMRATNDQVPAAVPVFGTYQLVYSKEAAFTNITGGTEATGAAHVNASYTSMATTLGYEISFQADRGFYPLSIAFIAPVGGIGTNTTVLRDTNLGRHLITVSCQGRFRFQNVTPAGAGDASTNINAIDANPVDGKIYTFRNQAPLFSENYVSTLTDAPTLAGIKALNIVRQSFEVYGTTTPGGSGKGGGAFTHIPAPPLNPSSVWRNVKSTGRAVFPPGGFKTYSTSYLRSETIAKYCQNISQPVEDVPAVTFAGSAAYPPAGDSFMMCLRPTIKTPSETIRMAYNVEFIMMASIKRRKASPLQVVNDIEN